MSNLYLALLHYPVLNKNGETVHTSVTNLDIHDIARSAATFGVKRYYLVTPDESQQAYLGKILSFWSSAEAQLYNPDRSAALSLISLCESLELCQKLITTQEGMQPITISTTARAIIGQITFAGFSKIKTGKRPVLILFGTGYGLCNEIHQGADYILEPINGEGSYNHLSVRSAVAIVLDRISSEIHKGRNNGYPATSRQRTNAHRLPRISRG